MDDSFGDHEVQTEVDIVFAITAYDDALPLNKVHRVIIVIKIVFSIFSFFVGTPVIIALGTAALPRIGINKEHNENGIEKNEQEGSGQEGNGCGIGGGARSVDEKKSSLLLGFFQQLPFVKVKSLATKILACCNCPWPIKDTHGQ